MTVTVKNRWIVIHRDSDHLGQPVCQWCGRWVDVLNGYYSLQHRRARNMGGSRLADTDKPQNLVLVCGSATTGCHGHIESHPIEAAERGFRLLQTQNPATHPITRWGGAHLYLTAAGRAEPADTDTPF